ncbi:Uncharacterised protein [Mycobacteroides abscessus]|nr:Uncharacterised protein [Mycobacteroides abscessus]
MGYGLGAYRSSASRSVRSTRSTFVELRVPPRKPTQLPPYMPSWVVSGLRPQPAARSYVSAVARSPAVPRCWMPS